VMMDDDGDVFFPHCVVAPPLPHQPLPSPVPSRGMDAIQAESHKLIVADLEQKISYISCCDLQPFIIKRAGISHVCLSENVQTKRDISEVLKKTFMKIDRT
jgi:hypothetical protein